MSVVYQPEIALRDVGSITNRLVFTSYKWVLLILVNSVELNRVDLILEEFFSFFFRHFI